MTLVYEYGENLYINLTNKCTNSCVFCVRNQGDIMAGNNLKLEQDANAKDIISDLEKYDLSKYKYIVFCGYGEPTMNLEALIQTAQYLRTQNVVIKLNTNGHGSIYNKYDITPKLEGLIDVISISLNEACATDYNKVSNCEYGEDGYSAVLDFTKSCKGKIPRIVLSVVDIISQDHIEKCKIIANELGAELRIRHYTNY